MNAVALRLRGAASNNSTLFSTGGRGVALNPKLAVGGLLVLCLYYVGARLGFALKFQPHTISVVWPPNSILLGILVLYPVRTWWFLLACVVPAHFTVQLFAGVPFSMAAGWFVTNVSEALIGASAARLLLGDSPNFCRLRTMAGLFLCAGFIAPLVSTFLDAGSVVLNGPAPELFWDVWKQRFWSNIFSAAIFTPVVVTWGRYGVRFPECHNPARSMEGIALSIGVVLTSIAAFYYQRPGPGTHLALLYAPTVFLVWAAVRFGQRGGSAAVLCVALVAIWGAIHGRGPFGSDMAQQNAHAIQVFFTMLACTLMFLSTSIAEHQEAVERFTKVFSASPDAVILTRFEDGRIIAVNERWTELLGYERQETIGRTVFDLQIYPSPEDRTRLIAEARRRGRFHDKETMFRTKSGEFRNVLVSANSEEINSEKCLIVTCRDLTDRKRAEEAERKLAQASRLALAGEISAMVAHEVKQPLGAILSNAETVEILLRSNTPPLDEIREIVSDIRDNDLRADTAVRQISLLLRKKEMKAQSLDVRELITDTIHLTASDAIRRRLSVNFQDNGPLPAGWGDRMHLQQVLVNLILNAMDAAENQPPPRRTLTISAKAIPDAIQISVSDKGDGIQPEKLSKIFDSFFTTREQGVGLGLAIARSIIDAHKGQIWAENNADGGATVHFTIPDAKNFEAHESGK